MKKTLEYTAFMMFCCDIFTMTSSIPNNNAPNPELYTGKKCYTNNDCKGSHVFCNELDHCECQFGYHPQARNDSLKFCSAYQCNTDRDCEKYYNSNTICNPLKNCACETSFTYSASHRQCWTNVTKLNSKCQTLNECGHLATCTDQNVCGCRIGSYAANDYGCTMFVCQNDRQCRRITPNSSCILLGKIGTCFCDDAYKANYPLNSGCYRRAVDRGDYCTSSKDCGYGVVCVSNKCKCLQGHIPSTSSRLDCNMIMCRNDTACGQIDSNSYCNILHSRCDCFDNYFVNPSTQTCEKLMSDRVNFWLVFGIVCWFIACVGVVLSLRFYLKINNRPLFCTDLCSNKM